MIDLGQTALLITGCDDSMLWYSNKIGDIVPFISADTDPKGPIYWSREPAGYRNIVFQKDAKIVQYDYKVDGYV